MIGIIRAFGALIFDYHPALRAGHDQPVSRDVKKSKGTVLMIDDDAELVEIIRPLLEERGFQVMTSSSGPKGLNILRYASHDIKVIMLDFNMPQFNGAETLHFIRQLAPHVKVVALTGVDLRLLPPSFRQSVDHFLQKPFLIEHVAPVLDALVTGATPAPAYA
jgi:CheY-like chemotaxis protein